MSGVWRTLSLVRRAVRQAHRILEDHAGFALGVRLNVKRIGTFAPTAESELLQGSYSCLRARVASEWSANMGSPVHSTQELQKLAQCARAALTSAALAGTTFNVGGGWVTPRARKAPYRGALFDWGNERCVVCTGPQRAAQAKLFDATTWAMNEHKCDHGVAILEPRMNWPAEKLPGSEYQGRLRAAAWQGWGVLWLTAFPITDPNMSVRVRRDSRGGSADSGGDRERGQFCVGFFQAQRARSRTSNSCCGRPSACTLRLPAEPVE